jgi:hypothetical protein
VTGVTGPTAAAKARTTFEALRLLRFTRTHAVRERRSALQLLRMSLVSARRNFAPNSAT